MKTPSEKVWELVRSLTKNENEQFYNRAYEYTRGKDSQYSTLYTAMRSMEIYDEEKLRETLKGEKLLKYLHRVKYHLYGKILEFLRSNRRDGKTQVANYLANIKFLFEKGLYHHLAKQIENGEKLAVEIEDFQAYLQILSYQRELIRAGKQWGFYGGDIQKVLKKERKLRKLDKERYKLEEILDSLIGMSRQFPDSNTIERAAQRINRMKPPKSKTAEVLSARVSLNIAMRTGKYEECIRYTDRIIDVFKKSPALIQGHTNFKLFVTAIYYGANFRTYLRQYKESDELMRLLESPLNVRQCDPGLYYEVKTLHELAMGIATYDLSRSRKAIGEYELLPAELHMQIPAIKQSEIFFTAAIASIIDGTPKDALRFVNIIRASKPTDIRNDLRQYIRVLFLIIHFDLNNLDVVETGIKAGRISFKRKNVLNPFYDAVFKLFSKMTRAKSIQKSEIAIREFLDHYSGEKAQFWASMNNYFNLRAWLTSKLEQRDFFKTLQEDEKL